MSQNDEITQKNMPYTVVGHTSIPSPRLSIVLTAKGIKELAKRTGEHDLVRIAEWSDVTEECEKKSHYGRITIIKRDRS